MIQIKVNEKTITVSNIEPKYHLNMSPLVAAPTYHDLTKIF